MPSSEQQQVLEREEAEKEALELGIGQPKSKAAPKPTKSKRTADELLKEELEKIEGEVAGLVDQLSTFPSGPTGMALGRVDRMVGRLVKQTKASRNFEATTTAENMAAMIDLLRTACKASKVCTVFTCLKQPCSPCQAAQAHIYGGAPATRHKTGSCSDCFLPEETS